MGTDTRDDYREHIQTMGKKEFTLLKMQEYGFWPKDLPTPHELQKNETQEEFDKRNKLQREYNDLAEQIANLYKEKSEINKKLQSLKKQYDKTLDYEKLRKDIAKNIMKESIARRKERKKEKEFERIKKSEDWKKYKKENIVFIGKGYSNLLIDKETNENKLISLQLPIIKDDKDLSKILDIEYKELRFLAYHRDVVVTDHYYRYEIQKKSGGKRNIAAPKPLMKKVQKNILEKILEKIKISEKAHGFVKGKSVITGADIHIKQPDLLIKIDIEDFFPSISFERVRGMFKSFGYSGYISSILAMLCTYCERIPIEIKDLTKYVKTSDRILPQGSPASPMISNIICRNLDFKMGSIEDKYNCIYSRYADDMSFSFSQNLKSYEIKRILSDIYHFVSTEGFIINKGKTKFLKQNNRQCVTGIVINNEELGVPRVWTKRMRAAIHNANELKKENKLSADKKNEIIGMVLWLKSINEVKYKKLISDAQTVLSE